MMFSDSEMHSTMSNENGFVLTQMKASRGSSWFVCLQRLLESSDNAKNENDADCGDCTDDDISVTIL